MGYLTSYSLRVIPHSYPREVIAGALTKATGSVGDDSANWDRMFIDELMDGDSEPQKWYGHDNDMVALSKELPDVLFRLSGVGEEQGDEWVKFYLNGEIETHTRQRWVPPNFPLEKFTYGAEQREKAKAGQQEHYDRIKAEQDARDEKRAQAKREAAAKEIQELAAKAGVEVIVKGVGE